MTSRAAIVLVAKVQAVWPERAWSQARIDQWVDAIEELDEGSTDTTLRRLRSTSETCPSIAAFVTNAKALTPQTSTKEHDDYDAVAGAAAHATFSALAATAETRADLANACFAAAAAYANAERKTLL